MMRFTKKMGALAILVASVTAGGAIALAHEGATDGARRAQILEKFDANHDGKLDDAEKAAMREQMKAMRAQRREQILARFDANRDGKLDDGERKVMIDTIAAERFKKLDANGDGVLSLDEFRAAAGPRHRFGRAGRGRL